MANFENLINKEGKNWYLLSVNKYGIATYETILNNGIKMRRSWDKFDLGMVEERRPQSYKIDCKIEEKSKVKKRTFYAQRLEDLPVKEREKLIFDFDIPTKHHRAFIKCDAERNPIKEYNNIYDASLDSGISVEKIKEACKNGTRTNKFYWERVIR